jgi:transglutaminase-like putative cysteine protease
MMFEVNHRTVYHYDAPVAQSHHLLHLTPRQLDFQRTIDHAITFEPDPATRSDFIDYFGNEATYISMEQYHSQLLIHSRLVVELTPSANVDITASEPWENLAAILHPSQQPRDLEVIQYLPPSRYTNISAALLDFATPSFSPGRPVLECAHDLMSRIFNEFQYDPAATDVATTVDDVLEIKRGVCQDFTHLFIAAMRAFNVPARYVSGYLLTRPPEGGEKLIGADASHAWGSVWAPGYGWVHFDPTNNMIPRDEHITVAYGRDFQDVSPAMGVLLGGASHHVEVAVDVVPVVAAETSAIDMDAGL